MEIFNRGQKDLTKLLAKKEKLTKSLAKHKYGPDYSEFVCLETIAIGGITAMLASIINVAVHSYLQDSIIKDYLTSPENSDKLQYLYEQTGFTDINAITSFLQGSDGFANALATQTGVQQAFDTSLTNWELGILGAIAAPYVASLAYNACVVAYDYGKYKMREHTKDKLSKIDAQIEELQDVDTSQETVAMVKE